MNLAAPLKVIIVEDQIAIRQYLKGFLQQQPGFIVTGDCGTVSDAIVLVHTTKPDLLLLDIQLPDGTGFDILEQISVQMKVIFLTAYEEYAIRALRYGAIDYLLKPLVENELREALQKVISAQPLKQEQIDITLQGYRKSKAPDRIVLRGQNGMEAVELKEIRYIHGDNGYTTVFLNGGKRLVTTKRLKDHEDDILSLTFFLRTNQSYLVNPSYIDRYHRKESMIYLKDGTQIPVSRLRKELVELYFKTRGGTLTKINK